jgi:diguanylate cyclase (GGDEF)-like protein
LKLKDEVVERLRVESTLHALIEMIMQQKDDLETIVQTIMEHGDVVDMQWGNRFVEATELANCDSLTQIANRRRFDEYLQEQWQQMGRSTQPLAVILGDIDHFKGYNDAYGHLQGDQCLQQIAQVLSQQLKRSTDLLARYGGEEFALVLPHTSLTGAQQIAERLRTAVRELQISHCQPETDSVITMSFGIACVVPSLEVTALTLVDQADQALYLAKQRGKDQVMSLSGSAQVGDRDDATGSGDSSSETLRERESGIG